MTCAEAREAILDADLPELMGQGDTDLARHVRVCPGCARIAGTVLSDQSALAELLTAAVAVPAPEALLSHEPDSDERPTSSPVRFRRLGTALLPLAAAAALGALIFGDNPRLPGEPYLPVEPAPGLGLEVPGGRNIAVLATSNPDITVLWLF